MLTGAIVLGIVLVYGMWTLVSVGFGQSKTYGRREESFFHTMQKEPYLTVR